MKSLSVFIARCARTPMEVSQQEALEARRQAQALHTRSPLRHAGVRHLFAVAVPLAAIVASLLMVMLAGQQPSVVSMLYAGALAVTAGTALTGAVLYAHWTLGWKIATRVMSLTQPLSRRTDPAWQRAAELVEHSDAARRLRDEVLGRDEPLRGYHFEAMERHGASATPPGMGPASAAV